MDENQPQNINGDMEKLVQELKDLLTSAKAEEKKIQQFSVKLSAKVEEVELYHKQFSELRSKLSDGQTGLQALLDQATNLKNQIQTSDQDAQKKLGEIDASVSKVTQRVTSIEEYHGTFTDLKNKLSDGQTGLQALLDQATNLKNQIQQMADTAKDQAGQISERFTEASIKVKEIEVYYNESFLPIKAKVDDSETGLQAVLGVATGLKDQIVKTKASTDEDHRKIRNVHEDTLRLKTNSEEAHKKIEEFKAKSEELKDDIEQTFKIATDVSLANSFNERKKDLEKEASKWLWHLTTSTGVLAVAVLGIYFSQYISNAAHPNDWKFWYRFAFTSPIIFYVYFASHNYGRTRDLLEKYAFKFAASLSLQSYTKLLTDNFKNDQHKDSLLEFTLRSIDMVYKEPYMDKGVSRKLTLGNGSIQIGIEEVERLLKAGADLVGESKSKSNDKNDV